MNTTSLEVSKKLYEVSGWKDTFLKHDVNGVFEGTAVETVYDKHVGVYGNKVGCDECEGEYFLNTVPAYDLGYLMRKLPPHIKLELDKRVDYDGEWSWNVVATSSDGFYFVEDGFLEDTVALLAIELFEQGILKKEKV